jgi:hypothetical protein
MQKNLILLFDSIRDPRDLAEMILLGLALDVKIELTGSSLLPNHFKVLRIINSWIPGFKDKPKIDNVKTYVDFSKRIASLKKQGYTIIGTSPNAKKSLFKTDLSNGKQAIVFGTETSGLSKEKMSLMDEIVLVPMKPPATFFTIRAVAPLVAYETMRQKKLI